MCGLLGKIHDEMERKSPGSFEPWLNGVVASGVAKVNATSVDQAIESSQEQNLEAAPF